MLWRHSHAHQQVQFACVARASVWIRRTGKCPPWQNVGQGFSLCNTIGSIFLPTDVALGGAAAGGGGSVAILKYLCRKHGVDWYPVDLRDQARTDEYLAWHYHNTCHHAGAVYELQVLFTGLQAGAVYELQVLFTGLHTRATGTIYWPACWHCVGATGTVYWPTAGVVYEVQVLFTGLQLVLCMSHRYCLLACTLVLCTSYRYCLLAYTLALCMSYMLVLCTSHRYCLLAYTWVLCKSYRYILFTGLHTGTV